jgi:DNA polymerase-3 subunit alpha
MNAVSAVFRCSDPTFRSLEDLCERVDRHALNKRVLESLIKAGALDPLPGTRRQKLARLDSAIRSGAQTRHHRMFGQAPMFHDTSDVRSLLSNHQANGADPAALSPDDRMSYASWERELLGLVFSQQFQHEWIASHAPLDRIPVIRLRTDAANMIGARVCAVGVLSRVTPWKTKRGETMITAVLEDDSAVCIEVVAFPRQAMHAADILHDGARVIIRGKIDEFRGVTKIVLDRIDAVIESTVAAREAPNVPPRPAMLDGFGSLPQSDTSAVNGVLRHAAVNGVQAPHDKRTSVLEPCPPHISSSLPSPPLPLARRSMTNGSSNPCVVEIELSPCPRLSDFETMCRTVRDILDAHPGDCPVHILMRTMDGMTQVRLQAHVSVQCGETMLAALNRVSGVRTVLVAQPNPPRSR